MRQRAAVPGRMIPALSLVARQNAATYALVLQLAIPSASS
ncbi:hypothetical protein trd_1764 [Thermomicrobium roseum DSM 5159]|uniref:Uncharacterized protein n=1 Tax=Thermomicrobium roseum (strain ATCC 27502 / DSM 5159 / P-2) TaxID=309801 RepID=B9L153_THERP|nr:hypothetical protein trd_1764 [Thermomicrobium roseum DSM 5159]